jgi:tetratricopeptide (TPR) repeat protein
MKTSEKHIHLFGSSGCINESSFFGYLNHELTLTEMHAIENHLSECLFCSDAIEGYEKIADKAKVQNDFAAIKSAFKTKQQNSEEFKKKDNKRYLVFAVSIAASLTIIISGYYLFQVLPTSDKKSEIALEVPSNKQDIPKLQNAEGQKSENQQEEEATKSIMEEQSEILKEAEKKTISDKADKYYDNREGWLESDGDAVSTSKVTGATGEFKSMVMAETANQQEQKAGNGKALTEDTEQADQIADATIAMDQKNELKQINAPIETIKIVDEVLSNKDVGVEEKVVMGKKGKLSDRNKNDKQPVAATGGVMRPMVTPTLNAAISDYNSGYFDQALAQFEYLTEQNKTNYAARYYLAMSYYNIGKKDSALIQFNRLIEKKNNPFYELALWQKAQITEDLNDKKQAVEIYREIIKNNGSLKTNALKKVDELEKSE